MILVAIPYHSNKAYCLEHLMEWIDNADLKDCDVVMRWHRGTFGEAGAVKTQREYFRLLALERNYSHLLFVGADTIPPVDVLPRLLAHNLPIVGGLYYGNTENSGAVAAKDSGGLVEVDWMGMDCVLFNREVLERFSWFDNPIPDDDYPVYDKLRQLGYKTMLDTDIRCKHYSTPDTYS